jgi:endonuclease/exonuclease/phosphatase family metal-dependent hydrolase
VNPSAIEFLADAYWLDWHYGKNAVYPKGHHGNAILSRYPLNKGLNYDLSAYRFERRGALHSVFEKKRLNGGMQSIHCFSIHLTLFEHGRKRQITQLIDEISYLAHSAPVIIAGDFNDWRNSLGPLMASYGFQEVFETLCGKPARTYPAFQPLLRMDRIYVRGLSARSARTLNHWANLSDHIGLLAELDLR